MSPPDGDGGADAPLLRCFVACFVADESARRLQRAVHGSVDPRLLARRTTREIPLANYHVTLKFLGEVGPSAVTSALEETAALAGRSIEAEATGLVGFPRSGSARLVAATLTGVPELDAWHDALAGALGAEDRSFRPHVTVLRLQRPSRFPALALARPVPLALMAPRLYRSDQTRDGVRYTPLEPGRPWPGLAGGQ